MEDGEVPKAESGKLADAINEAKRWGILPLKVAESMLSAGGKDVPPEYREIISRYYKRMTEIQTKGR